MNLKELAAYISKSGNIPTDFSIGGALTPDQARAFFTLVVEQNAFLGQVSHIFGKKLTIPIRTQTMGERVLVRVAEGSEPTAAQKAQAGEAGKNASLLPVQLFADLPFSSIEDNQDNPNFENEFSTALATTFGNDLLDLGSNGTADSGSTFLTLCKGWNTLAKERSTTNKVNTHDHTSLLDSLAALLAAMPDKYKTPDTAFIVGQAEMETWQKLMGLRDASAALLLNGNAVTYLGYKIITNPYQPAGTYLFCNPKELVYVLNLDVKKYREVHARKRAVQYTYDLNVDYELGREPAIVIGYDQGA